MKMANSGSYRLYTISMVEKEDVANPISDEAMAKNRAPVRMDASVKLKCLAFWTLVVALQMTLMVNGVEHLKMKFLVVFEITETFNSFYLQLVEELTTCCLPIKCAFVFFFFFDEICYKHRRVPPPHSF